MLAATFPMFPAASKAATLNQLQIATSRRWQIVAKFNLHLTKQTPINQGQPCCNVLKCKPTPKWLQQDNEIDKLMEFTGMILLKIHCQKHNL